MLFFLEENVKNKVRIIHNPTFLQIYTVAPKEGTERPMARQKQKSQDSGMSSLHIRKQAQQMHQLFFSAWAGCIGMHLVSDIGLSKRSNAALSLPTNAYAHQFPVCSKRDYNYFQNLILYTTWSWCRFLNEHVDCQFLEGIICFGF